MGYYISIGIFWAIVIAVVAYASSRTGSKKRSAPMYHHRCPFCGADYGELPRDRAVCSDCKRLYVIGRTPTAEEKSRIGREASEIAFISSPAFPLETAMRTAAEAFCDVKRYASTPNESCFAIKFTPDHMEAVIYESYGASRERRILDYPRLGTEAAQHALTAACFRHLTNTCGALCASRRLDMGDFDICWVNE